ncbi:MAG: hypothetical protein C0618_07755 [Desulfuromonas sp.]|nr:MAG: hypothetical protein C0618_07755 [Desulfuromonas sp.]
MGHQNRRSTTFRYLLLIFSAAVISIGATGCAPQQVTSPDLRAEIQHLQQQQQQQQQLLNQLRQHLAALSVPSDAHQPPQEPDQSAPSSMPRAPETSGHTARLQQNDIETLQSAQAYLQAFADLATGRSRDAHRGFSDFLRTFENHPFAAHARFWLAEANLALGNDAQAVEALNDLATDPETKEQAPAALARLARYYAQHDRIDQANEALTRLKTQFPQSPEARRSQPTDFDSNRFP